MPHSQFPHRPLTIVRILNWLPVGGVERRVVELLPRLDRAKFHPHIILLRERGPLAARAEEAGIQVHLSPMRTRLAPGGLWRLARLLRSLKADVVHSHMYRSNTPATFAARMAGVPVILSQVHNVDTWETRRQVWMDRNLCRWRAGVIAVSESVKRDIVNRLGLEPDFVRVIYNGIDLGAFSAASEALRDPGARRVARQKEKLPGDGVIAVCVARLHEQKNHLGLLRAFAKIAQECPALSLWLVGDGPKRPAIEEETRQLGLEGRVHFAGRRNDVPMLLPLADFSVLPSFKEGFSNVVLESLAAGLPIALTRVGGNDEAVRDGSEGLLIEDPNDLEALAAALKRLALDAALRRQMSASALQRVQTFSIENMARQVSEYYLECWGKKSGAKP